MIFNTTGGGGTPLNFKVVDGTTAPTNPKENTIWVKTSTPLPTNVSGYAWEMRKAGMPNWETYVGCTVFSYDSSYSGQVSNTSTAAFDIYAAKNPKRQIHALLTACYQNQDGTTSGWKKMNAYIYKSGSWVQFSSEFAATIAVTYPSGSTLTCTDGTTTLKATTTTGSYTFTVPNTGTWTVSCTDGTDTATDTVEITADGQSESVELSYSLHISPATYEYSVYNKLYGKASVSDETIKISYTEDGANSECVVTFKNAIDVTKYSTLQATANITKISDTAGNGRLTLGVASSKPSSYNEPSAIASVNAARSTGTQTLTVSLDSVNKDVYVYVSAAICKATVTDIKLIP